MWGVELTRLNKSGGFRKMAMGIWTTAKDPSVYGALDIDMSQCLPFLERVSKESGVKVTPSHFVGCALSRVMKAIPDINGLIRWRRIYLRKHVDLFFQVAVPAKGDKKANLAGCVVRGAENLTVLEIAQDLRRKVEKIRDHKDEEVNRGFQLVRWMPWSFMGVFLDFLSWVLYGLNLNLSWLGIPRDPFGSVMITNIGSFGIDTAWAPLVPYTRVPLLLTVCALRDKPVAIEGRVEVRPVMTVTVTFDHRFMDGSQASAMCHQFLKYFREPETLLAAGE